MANAPKAKMSATEYLAWEREQPSWHEYFDGEVFEHGGVFAVADVAMRHAALQAAVTIQLGIGHRGGRCRAMGAGQRIALAGRDGYADASVVCGPLALAPGTKDTLVNPSVVVEVLSASTEAYDRGAKWEGYQKLASLTDFLLVSQSATRVEHFQREPSGDWRYRVYGPGGRVSLATGASLDVDAVYRGAFELEGD